MKSSTIIHCYVAVSEEYGRRFHFNRMPDDLTLLPDTTHFFNDKSVEDYIPKEEKDRLKDVLCKAIGQKAEYIRGTHNDYPFGLYELAKNGFYIKFDLQISVNCPEPGETRHVSNCTTVKVTTENMKKFLDELRAKKKADFDELERKFLYYFGNPEQNIE